LVATASLNESIRMLPGYHSILTVGMKFCSVEMMKGIFPMSQLSPAPAAKNSILLNDKVYNVLKHVAAIGLPAAAALYYALAQIWHFSHPGQIMATISAVNTFIGIVVGVSNIQYNNSDSKYDGDLQVVDSSDKKKTFALAFNEDPQNLDQLDEVRLKVKPAPPTSGNPPQLGV